MMSRAKTRTLILAFMFAVANAQADDAEKQRVAELTAKNLAHSQMCASYNYDQDHEKDLSNYSKEDVESCAKPDSDVLTMVQGVGLSLGLIVVGTVHFVAEVAGTWANLTGCMAGACGK
jgi:hypothetical protein